MGIRDLMVERVADLKGCVRRRDVSIWAYRRCGLIPRASGGFWDPFMVVEMKSESEKGFSALR